MVKTFPTVERKTKNKKKSRHSKVPGLATLALGLWTLTFDHGQSSALVRTGCIPAEPGQEQRYKLFSHVSISNSNTIQN